jgi:hypothetical protein
MFSAKITLPAHMLTVHAVVIAYFPYFFRKKGPAFIKKRYIQKSLNSALMGDPGYNLEIVPINL